MIETNNTFSIEENIKKYFRYLFVFKFIIYLSLLFFFVKVYCFSGGDFSAGTRFFVLSFNLLLIYLFWLLSKYINSLNKVVRLEIIDDLSLRILYINGGKEVKEIVLTKHNSKYFFETITAPRVNTILLTIYSGKVKYKFVPDFYMWKKNDLKYIGDKVQKFYKKGRRFKAVPPRAPYSARRPPRSK